MSRPHSVSQSVSLLSGSISSNVVPCSNLACCYCNTPLARTPSNSVSMSMSIDMTMSMRTSANSRRGSQSAPYHATHTHSKNDAPMSPLLPPSAFHLHHYHHHHPSAFDDTLEEDERMVEDLLLLPAPAPAHPPHLSTACSAISPSPSFHGESTVVMLPSPTGTSSFTTSDPFYLSQLQASQQAFTPSPAAAQGLFAQNGRITPGSRFALQAAF